MEAPLIRAYPRESAVAEKFHAMVVLDIRNSSMKDFYDVWFMASTWTFEMASLRKAIVTSFERRGSTIPTAVPFALTDDFLDDPQKKQQWSAFVSRLNPTDKAPSLEEVGALLHSFLLPCVFGKSPIMLEGRRWTPDLGGLPALSGTFLRGLRKGFVPHIGRSSRSRPAGCSFGGGRSADVLRTSYLLSDASLPYER
jgi:hypothetical protein